MIATLYCECASPIMDVEHDAGCRRCGRPVDFSPRRPESELALERRLWFEARERHGGIYEAGATDTARVTVTWWEHDGSVSGYQRAGYLIVGVRCNELADDASEEERMANHPASRAEELASAELERRAKEHGWLGWEISDVTAEGVPA